MAKVNLVLGFAEIAMGGLLITAGLSKSHSVRDVLAGTSTLGSSDINLAADTSQAGRTTGGPPIATTGGAAGKSVRDSTGRPSSTGAGGFVPLAGTDFTHGSEPQIAARLGQLARKLGQTIYGISGYRSPAHSVAVGGFANDPHTQGIATDFGFGSALRSSAAQVTDAQLASVGLYRPFAGPAEINHVQLIN